MANFGQPEKYNRIPSWAYRNQASIPAKERCTLCQGLGVTKQTNRTPAAAVYIDCFHCHKTGREPVRPVPVDDSV